MADRRRRERARLTWSVPTAFCVCALTGATVFGVPAAANAEPTPTQILSPTPSLTPTTDTPAPTPPSSPTPDPSPSPSTSPSPSPSPSQPVPSPSGPEPSPTSEPTPDPTTAPTEPPRDDPAPTAPPTSPPTDQPQPRPTETKDPDEAYEEALLGAQTKAVAEAQRLIQLVLGEIAAAEVSLETATAEAAAAKKASDEAARTLQVTEEAAARTQRDITALHAEQTSTRRTLGVVAAEAYQSGGTTTVGALFSSDTPAELTDKYVGLDVLLRANDRALGTMAAGQADLRNAQDRLESQLQRGRQQADEAEQLAASTAQAQKAAEVAQTTLEDQNAKLEYALQLAEEARLEDYRRYMELIGESTALGELLRDKTDYGPGYGTGDFIRPATGDFTSEYGPRLHPILGYVKIHTGLDFGRGDGAIYAADAGTVIKAEWNRAYGYMVVVDHGLIDGRRISTMYAHQPSLSVDVGQRVEKGQPIGSIGSTGYSTGPHLHFEVYVDGEHTDPMPWIRNAPLPN